MKIKTARLTEVQLDWCVAKIRELDEHVKFESVNGVMKLAVPRYETYYEPSSDWGQGGPIIAQEGIELTVEGPYVNGRVQVASWDAMIPMFPNRVELRGNSPLVAAMRAYVHSKFGAEVEVPEELCDEDL